MLAYVGDTGNKHRHVESGYLKQLGLILDEHGKMPDVIIHLPRENWLVLIEAVTSHGPIGLKRHNELKDLFKEAKAGLVFVTAFLMRRAISFTSTVSGSLVPMRESRQETPANDRLVCPPFPRRWLQGRWRLHSQGLGRNQSGYAAKLGA